MTDRAAKPPSRHQDIARTARRAWLTYADTWARILGQLSKSDLFSKMHAILLCIQERADACAYATCSEVAPRVAGGFAGQ
jgi:hypothetical protein